MGELTAVASVKRGVRGDLSDLEDSLESALVTFTSGAFLSWLDMIADSEDGRTKRKRSLIPKEEQV